MATMTSSIKKKVQTFILCIFLFIQSLFSRLTNGVTRLTRPRSIASLRNTTNSSSKGDLPDDCQSGSHAWDDSSIYEDVNQSAQTNNYFLIQLQASQSQSHEQQRQQCNHNQPGLMGGYHPGEGMHGTSRTTTTTPTKGDPQRWVVSDIERFESRTMVIVSPTGVNIISAVENRTTYELAKQAQSGSYFDTATTASRKAAFIPLKDEMAIVNRLLADFKNAHTTLEPLTQQLNLTNGCIPLPQSTLKYLSTILNPESQGYASHRFTSPPRRRPNSSSSSQSSKSGSDFDSKTAAEVKKINSKLRSLTITPGNLNIQNTFSQLWTQFTIISTLEPFLSDLNWTIRQFSLQYQVVLSDDLHPVLNQYIRNPEMMANQAVFGVSLDRDPRPLIHKFIQAHQSKTEYLEVYMVLILALNALNDDPTIHIQNSCQACFFLSPTAWIKKMADSKPRTENELREVNKAIVEVWRTSVKTISLMSEYYMELHTFAAAKQRTIL